MYLNGYSASGLWSVMILASAGAAGVLNVVFCVMSGEYRLALRLHSQRPAYDSPC